MASKRETTSLKSQWFHILLAVADHERHGADIMKMVLERTDGRIHLWPGMLYRSLRTLVADGMLEEKAPPPDASTAGGTPRYYGITERGREALVDEASLMASFVDIARDKKLLPRSGS
jgi:DNA-binding PadR family transcriptional regulator